MARLVATGTTGVDTSCAVYAREPSNEDGVQDGPKNRAVGSNIFVILAARSGRGRGSVRE